MSRDASRALAITRVRLVGFHNFGDVSLELSATTGDVRTHLFLAGDNGSGKSTVLDAIHLVLTGADVELNAAARTGARPRAAPGRTLAGIVLRQRDERVREGHAIAYAALELASGSERWTIGIGLGATTLDAMVTRWGFVHAGALATVPLLRETERGVRPLTPDELAAAIGRTSVHARIGDYRARIAALFFGGEVGYERACRLWSLAKAYREMVASTREPSEIVTRFLPPPRSDAIASIRTSLAQLGELEQDAKELDAQRARWEGIVRCQEDIARLRREGRVLEARIEQARLARLVRERGENDAQRQALEVELARAEERCAHSADEERRVAAMRAAAQTGEVGAWVAARDAAVAVRDVRRAELARAEAGRERAQRGEREALDGLERVERELARADEQAFRALGEAVEGATRLGRLLPFAADVARKASGGDLARAHDELEVALRDARAEHAEAIARLRAAERSVELAERGATPTLAAWDEALSELTREGIDAVALSRALEPKSDADPMRLAALEALVPSDVWGTLLTREEHLTRARVILAAHPGARLSTCAMAPALPAWVERLLEAPTTQLEVRAHATLACELASVEGALAAPDSLGGATLRGVYVRAGALPPRLGERARVRAQQARASEHQAACTEALAERARAEEGRARTEEEVSRVGRALDALRSLGGAELGALRSTREHRAATLALARSAVADAEAAVGVAHDALDAAERSLAACETSAPGMAQQLETMTELDATAQRAGAARVAALEDRARLATRRADLDERRRALEAEIRALRAQLGIEAQAEVMGDADVAPEDLERERERLRREERARSDELFGDGSRGIHAPELAPKLTCVSESGDAPELTDAAGRAPASILAELDRHLSEVRSAVNERTRDVFDGVVMGSLASQLQREVEQLHTTVQGINEQLGHASYGGVRYAFRVTPRPDRAELVSLVRRMSVLDPSSRNELRRYVEERRSDLAAPGDEPPALLDYRRWFDVRLVTRRQGEGDSPWSRERAATGSGGEQGVPHHLVVFALARLAFEGARARLTPLLLDEAFHGIDATRREALLGLASELDLQLVVATPDQDGLVRGLRSTTTLFVVKDEHDDVHVVPYHYYDHSAGTQTALAM